MSGSTARIPNDGESANARYVGHILFQVTERVDLERLRERAQATLDDVLRADDPDAHFASSARGLSNCPSGAAGGSLGEIGRGDTVPEFERAVFATPANSFCPTLVETRFGFHIVRVFRKAAGAHPPVRAGRGHRPQCDVAGVG